ncbi:hypothetical protein [Lysinibacillus pakistanensis]|uniref:Uncharacterized protein n=1 Tax=Lysinibacillus pakistanensis TaxID=759811 RepID=A0ABX6DGT3_9BACI|nr:hypothetical protein GDS87_24140 [Lysinibacillus pakistanensis]
MLKTRIGYIICFSIILGLFVFSKSINTKSMVEKRLDFLEPPEPTTIFDSPLPFEKGTEVHFPTDVISISEVLKEGTRIAFKIIKSELNYIRPIYKKTGIALLEDRAIFLLEYTSTAYSRDLDLYLVVFQTNITDVFTKGNLFY